MGSINDVISVIYAGESNESFGVSSASSLGSTSRSGNMESRNIITSKNSYNNKFDLHGITYDDPLSLDLIFYNLDGTYIDTIKERQLKKWLFQDNYDWLQINQIGMDDTQYFCIANSVEMINVGDYSGGLKVSFICQEPWAHSDIKKKIYTTVGNTLTRKLNMSIDFNKYIIYPSITITALGNGTVSINNSTTNQTVSITGCTTNEIISLDTSSDRIKTTGTNIISRWNKADFGFVDGENNIILTGNFKVEIQYRLPIRIGN